MEIIDLEKFFPFSNVGRWWDKNEEIDSYHRVIMVHKNLRFSKSTPKTTSARFSQTRRGSLGWVLKP